MKLKTLLTAALAAITTTASAENAKYIFYFIGDGMGMGPTVAAEMYNRQILGNDTPITMMQFPVAGYALTYSASSPVTDSAAAGTALSTGSKTKNGMLGMNADTVAVNSIARDLQKAGYGIGIATSVAADDATPGAFYAHVPNRGMSYEIDLDAAKSGYQFIAGSEMRGMKIKGEPTDILEIMQQNGVEVVRGHKALSEATSEKIYLLPDTGKRVEYTIDSIADNMSLPIITQACLDHMLKVSPDKFFMMVEGGNIDHALHAKDGGAAIKEILNFNEAIAIAYEFYKKHPDETLIVVTADHDTGGMTIGSPQTGYWANLKYIDYQRASKEGFQRFCRRLLDTRRTYTWDDMREYLADNFGFWKYFPIKEEQEKALKEKFDSTFEKREAGESENTLYASFNQFVTEVFNVFNQNAGLGFVTTNHTGNPVPVFAIGVDAQRFTHLNNNIEIPAIILQAALGNK